MDSDRSKGMDRLYDDSIEVKIGKLEAEEAGLDYEFENDEDSKSIENERPFDAEKIRIDQQMATFSK